ncbi:hypothetical protein QE152_g9503 [Popillia japonica]|uniref:Uncharacterized protein n=1 Tax=Popillia japonica TaxID=7064 RepID=A0AAW1LWT7_POPJA
MIMMRPTSASKTGKPPPPVPPRPSKINNSSDSLGRTKRFAPDVPHKPTVPFRSAPPPPSSRVYQLREAFSANENYENNKINPIVKSQSYSAVNFSNKPSLERSISQDGSKKSRTVIFESSNLKNTIEIKRQDSDRRIEKVQVNGIDESNKLDGNKNEIIKNECGYTMDIMHEMLADAIKKDMDEENRTKITVHSDDDTNIKDNAPKPTVLIIEDKHNINEEESKKDDLPMKESDDDNKSNSSTGERKKDRHVKFDDKMNHEHLIDELQNMKLEQERILKRQRKPSKDIYENESAINAPINKDNKDKPKILHSDWIEVNDGEEVRLSSCQITIDERRETKDEILSPNSVEPLISRLATMSNLHGLPPLPKSLSNFNFLEGPPTPNRSRNATPPMSNTGTTHLVYPPHPKPMANGGTTQGSVSNLDAQLAILRREMVSVSFLFYFIERQNLIILSCYVHITVY